MTFDEAYSLRGHIVQVVTKENDVITGYLDDCEKEFDNFEGDAMYIDTSCQHLPYKYPDTAYPEEVFIRDIKSADIIE